MVQQWPDFEVMATTTSVQIKYHDDNLQGRHLALEVTLGTNTIIEAAQTLLAVVIVAVIINFWARAAEMVFIAALADRDSAATTKHGSLYRLNCFVMAFTIIIC